MAKRRSTSSSRKGSSRRKSSDASGGIKSQFEGESRGRSGSHFSSKVKEFSDNPAVRYIAGTLAAAAMSKLIEKMSTSYPEITKLVRGTFGSIEDKLVEFKEGPQKSDRGGANLQH